MSYLMHNVLCGRCETKLCAYGAIEALPTSTGTGTHHRRVERRAADNGT